MKIHKSLDLETTRTRKSEPQVFLNPNTSISTTPSKLYNQSKVVFGLLCEKAAVKLSFLLFYFRYNLMGERRKTIVDNLARRKSIRKQFPGFQLAREPRKIRMQEQKKMVGEENAGGRIAFAVKLHCFRYNGIRTHVSISIIHSGGF